MRNPDNIDRIRDSTKTFSKNLENIHRLCDDSILKRYTLKELISMSRENLIKTIRRMNGRYDFLRERYLDVKVTNHLLNKRIELLEKKLFVVNNKCNGGNSFRNIDYSIKRICEECREKNGFIKEKVK